MLLQHDSIPAEHVVLEVRSNALLTSPFGCRTAFSFLDSCQQDVLTGSGYDARTYIPSFASNIPLIISIAPGTYTTYLGTCGAGTGHS